MKSTFCALLASLTLSASSGCCLVDCFLGHHCGQGGACDNCSDEGCCYCGPHCGACGCCGDDCSCPPGGCGPGGCGNGGYGAGGYTNNPQAGGYAEGGYGPDMYASGGGCGPNCGCGACGRSACSPVPDCYTKQQAVASQLGGPAGPPSAQVTYPYYTSRGPRDFFAKNPPSIGP